MTSQQAILRALEDVRGKIYIDEAKVNEMRSQGWLLAPPTGFQSNYRPQWQMWHALREVYQNCLDETGEFTVAQTQEYTKISDNGKGFMVTALLLGAGTKPKPAYARGQFGEGMKLA